MIFFSYFNYLLLIFFFPPSGAADFNRFFRIFLFRAILPWGGGSVERGECCEMCFHWLVVMWQADVRRSFWLLWSQS